METSKQILSQEKRVEKSKDIQIQFTYFAENFCYFNVVTEEKSMKYIGRIEIKKSLSEYCSCKDNLHNNSKSFQDSHGYALQCKHMIRAKQLRGWYN